MNIPWNPVVFLQAPDFIKSSLAPNSVVDVAIPGATQALRVRRRPALGKDVKHKKQRAEFIRQSQLRGVEIALKRRTAQLRDNQEGGHMYMTAFRRSQRRI